MADELSDDVIGAAVLAGMADPVVVLGPDAELLWANHAAEVRFGWSLEDLRGMSLSGLVHPDDLETALLSLASVASKEVGTLVEIRIKDATDSYSWFENRGSGWDDGPVPGAVIVDLRESTERRKWELGAGNTQMLGAILDATPTISMLLNADGTIRGANRALTRCLHRPLEGTLGRSLLELVTPRDKPLVQAELGSIAGSGATRRFEARLLTHDGGEVPMSLTIVDLMADNAVQGLVVAAVDITSLVDVRTELRHLATHDELTGLPNRTNLRERLAAVLQDGGDGSHTLLFADVDSLKPINDHHGHRAGDAVLTEVGARLRDVLRDDDFVARMSGDEFVMIISTTEPGVVGSIEERIAAVMATPVTLPDGKKVQVSMSTGVAESKPGLGVDELLAAADAAMYVAKRERSG
jgi:diguanylate cyclase (GGDEF)-like protein/PAS domain S-box-containing protein